MIVQLKKKDKFLIKSIEDIFIEENHELNILNNFSQNPFTNYYIYLIENTPVGIINYNIIYDRCEIVDIYVLVNYRRNRIAYELLNSVIDIAKKINLINITLEVKVSNYQAINLYKKFGFVAVAKREKYYSGIDAILMEKEMRK